MSIELNKMAMEEKRMEKCTKLAIEICIASPIVIVAICFIISGILRSF